MRRRGRIFFNRRELLCSLGAVGAAAACTASESKILKPALTRREVFPADRNKVYAVPPTLDPAVTPRLTAGRHNNFYEMLPGRAGEVWKAARAFTVEPWSIEVTGECDRPMTLDLDALFSFPHEERLYHFRCVERWAMNIPWSGFPLRLLLEHAGARQTARFVRFVSAHRPEQMPGLAQTPYYPWPYHEGLRIDEAMHDLTLLATGVYGEPLPRQHGAPARIVVPWKYGYKSPKSVVKIELLAEQPTTFWQQSQPHEYGFLSNVNPNIPHPRWSQEHSYWLDDALLAPVLPRRFETPLFNGYGDLVAHLYPDEPRTPQRPLQVGEVAR
jgi:sulfoxide reductase catalytic subunit YedY